MSRANGHLVCLGLGYSAGRIAQRLAVDGWRISGTARTPAGVDAIAASGYDAFLFDGTQPNAALGAALRDATHILLSAPPGPDGDPLLVQHRSDLEHAPNLKWIGYLSTLGVYGNSDGEWIDETTPPRATSARGQRRIASEAEWLAFGKRIGATAQVFRLAGIYGPGRSAIERMREGTAHRIIKPGQVFNRIHVDDIAAVVCAAMERGAHDIYNVADGEPSPPQDVITYAAELLQMPPPPEVPFEEADLSPMAISFYADNRRVSNQRIREALGVELKYPNYREGLRAIVSGASV
ncbi:SDR family oxidoreductase [Hyphomicrobium sp. D-2]|uniref:SDR family oxidoreductase n=1 Tax=Hyphomicrobium sp. D-2 TaxID=3041621 RepID=UPI002457B731|nr:SDR family oxidoreductase [Hyphomicrobium sp. D-2]MDH4982595.1 SDR family oxidoreductase [Hyphomicrobium sp. D-2]